MPRPSRPLSSPASARSSVAADPFADVNASDDEVIRLLAESADQVKRDAAVADEQREIMTKDEVAKYLRVHQRTIDRWEKEGKFPKSARYAGRKHWRRSVVFDWFDAMVNKSQVSFPFNK